MLEGNDWLNGMTRLYVHKPKPGATTYGHPVRVNRWGFRGNDFQDRDAEGWDTFRIMVLGDSITAGQGVAEEDRFTEVLERALRQKYPDVKLEVINLGVQGFETLQEQKILERMWPVVSPNLAIVEFCENDPNISYKYYLEYKLPVGGRMRSVFGKLLSFRIADTIYDPLVRKIAHIPSHQVELDEAYKPESRDWLVFEASVRRIGEFTTKETGKKPLVIAINDVKELKEHNTYWPVRSTFEKGGFIWLDLGETIRYEPVSRFENHPNEKTHQHYAEALFERIVQMGIVPEWLSTRQQRDLRQ